MYLFLVLRLLVALAAWLIWWRRRGRTRKAVSLSVTVWAAISAVLIMSQAPLWWLLAFDTFGALWLVLAMTPRRPELTALRESEAKFAAAFRHSLDSVILTAVPSGEILEVNDGFTLLTGIERQHAVGHTTLELGVWADLDDRQLMMETLRRDGRIEGLAADFIRHDDPRPLHGLLWGELIEIQDQTCLLTVVRDVTEPRRQDKERSRLIEELEAKNRELERFAYTVAHDLRNPLMSIRGFVDLARLDLEAGELAEVPDHLMRISGGSERLQDLLESLLELSKAGKIIEDRQNVDMRALTDVALELLAASVESSGAEIRIADSLPGVEGDRTRLLQVMQNLLANALGCLGDQKRPCIEVGALDGDTPSGPGGTFFVRDNGLGIEPDQLESIFTLFERGSNPGEGTGIGLALVRRIVEGHDGRVWAESEGPGRGSTFYFTLPLAANLDDEPKAVTPAL